MDAQTLRRALFDLFRFSPSDFYVRAAGTGYLVEIAKKTPIVPEIVWPFKGYKSKYTGTGTPPTDQAFRVRIHRGRVNGMIPTNNSEEFTCTPSATTVFYVQGSFTSDGGLVSSVIDQGTDVPPDPAGSVNNAPATSSWALFEVDADANGITEIHPMTMSQLSVGVRVISVTCEGNTLAYEWVGAAPAL